jgi:hypothetical protein
VYLKGTLLSRIAPWQRVGHFEKLNARTHSTTIRLFPMVARGYALGYYKKKIKIRFSASVLHWEAFSEQGIPEISAPWLCLRRALI